MIKNPPAYLDYIFLMDQLKSYASPKSKLTTMIRAGELIKVRRGIYLYGDSSSYSLKTLANKIYGPSYLSFEYALSYYNLILERVDSLTSASLDKNKAKQFKTPLGFFIYRSVNPVVYPHGIVRIEEGESPFLIATKEKALCDTLAKIRRTTSIMSLKDLLFKDLRLDKEEVLSLNKEDVAFLVPLYKKKILFQLLKYLEEES